MKVMLYRGGERFVAKSGVGQAIAHQQAALEGAGVAVTDQWAGGAGVVHINTVLPDSVLAALRARATGRKVVYYGHSTMEDFRRSFKGSDLLAPLFRRWIKFCYGLGDVVVTPTEYSRRLLEEGGVRRPVYSLSNGVDTDFFAPSALRGRAFREKYGIGPAEKVVVSVGHYIARKGLAEFVALARRMPAVRFFWFGWTDLRLVPREIREAIASAPANVTFPGYVGRADLRDAYCGADAFVFLSHEETEGIVVLEALSCGVPVLVRDIPVYAGWLRSGADAYKFSGEEDCVVLLAGMLSGTLPDLTAAGRRVAESRSLRTVGARLLALYRQAGLTAAPAAAPAPVRPAGRPAA